MKKIITLLAIAAMSAFIMISCSGSGSSKGPFGSLPEVYEQFHQEKDKIAKEAESITTEAEKAKLMEKSNKMQEKFKAKLEESAKALDGKVLTLEESDQITVMEPISFQFDRFFSESDLQSVFKVNGKAEVATDIAGERIGPYYKNPTKYVYLVGYNAEGKDIYEDNIGSIDAENRDGYCFVPAGTPVKFSSLMFAGIYGNEEIQTLKLEVR